MSQSLTLAQWTRYKRAAIRRRKRLLFSSPAEVKFIELFGGRVYTTDLFTNKNGFPLTIVVSMGRLRREGVKREVRAGACWIDFSVVNKYSKKGIEIDGFAFHRDVVHELERDEYVAKFGFQLLHIQATDLYRNPKMVKAEVLKYWS